MPVAVCITENKQIILLYHKNKELINSFVIQKEKNKMKEANEKRLIDIDDIIEDLGCSDYDTSVKLLLEHRWKINRIDAVILPCKVGSTVWDRKAEPWTVISVEWFSQKVTHLHCVSPITGRRHTFTVGKRSIGKTVFLTCEAATKALAKMDGVNNNV
jgi:hypothetical protein